MKYFKILDSIELKLKNRDFNPKQDRHTQIIIPPGSILHPFNGEVIKHNGYIKTITTSHQKKTFSPLG